MTRDPSRNRETTLTALQREALTQRIQRAASRWPARIPIKESERYPAPPSHAQQRLLFVERMSPGRPVYNVHVAARLQGRLDVEALRGAIAEVVRRHDALRTVFDGEGKQWAQACQQVSVPLRTLDARAFASPDAAARGALTEEARRPFSLDRGPLLRACLVHTGVDEHMFGLVVHHLVADGWSIGVLLHDLATAYADLANGRSGQLAPLSLQYADYCHWERSPEFAKETDKDIAFWTQRLADSVAIELPRDRCRPAVPSGCGGLVHMRLSGSTVAKVRRMAEDTGSTPFVVLLTTFLCLLHRHSGQLDLRVGTPVAGRQRSEFEVLIGLFVNMLVVRADLDGNPSFRELVLRVRDTVVDALSHASAPIERLARILKPTREAGRPPLFEVAFVLQNAPVPTTSMGGLQLSPLMLDNGTAKFDLTLFLYDAAEGMDGCFEYDADLFDRERIERMAEHFEVLLLAALEDPGKQACSLPWMTQREQALVLSWAGNIGLFQDDRCVHEVFDLEAKRRPDATAVLFGDQTMSYRELRQRAFKLSLALRRRGVAEGDVVPLLLERSVTLPVALLGILGAGASYLPVDLDAPAARVRAILDDVGAHLVLTSTSLAARVEVLGATPCCIEQLEAEAIEGDGLLVRAPPTRAVYTMYTSGSSGHPKGVRIPHQAVIRLVKDTDYASFGSDEVFLQLAPVSFDASTFEIWGALLNGGTLAIMPPGPATPQEIGAAIRRHNVTTAWLTAGLFHLMVDEHIGQLEPLRQLLAGGDILHPSHVKRALRQLPNCKLINGYGPTEATTFACCHRIDPSERLDDGVPIGRPIDNTNVFLLDGQRCPVAIGVPGEVYIGGPGLALDYVHDPALTADRFVPSPFGPEGARLYRTGDLARYRSDGVIEFLGRAEQGQVKIRGHRVEVVEVATALRDCPGVEDAVVTARTGSHGDLILVAYVVAPPDRPLSSETLRQSLVQVLPGYMIPSFIVSIDHLPLTPNGKVDYRRLPAPHPEPRSTLPANAFEARIAGIVASVLEVDSVSLERGFFEQGGHSLLALRLVGAIQQGLGVDLPLRTLYATRTLRELAEVLDAKADTGPATQQVEVDEPRLDTELMPKRSVAESNDGVILLTGASGFLGAYLLRALLDKTDATICCLVRASDDAAARSRILAALDRFGLSVGAMASTRLRALAGDLSVPHFGLPMDAYDHLGQELRAVYHNGATVNLVAPYRELERSNVLSIEEVLRLASVQGASVHYVSSVSAVPPGWAAPAGRHLELDLPERSTGVVGGYAQSKWAAERLLVQARRRGFRVTLYRPGRLTGDLSRGRMNADDFLCRLIRGCIELGLAPDLDVSLDMTPVDYASRALVALSRSPRAEGVFHLVNPSPSSAYRLFDFIVRRGYPLKLVPYEQWRSILEAGVKAGAYEALAPLLGGMPERLPAAAPENFDCSRVVEALRDSSLDCPPVDERLFAHYFDSMLADGVLPMPCRTGPGPNVEAPTSVGDHQ